LGGRAVGTRPAGLPARRLALSYEELAGQPAPPTSREPLNCGLVSAAGRDREVFSELPAGHRARRLSRSRSRITTPLPSSRSQPREAKSASALFTVSRDAPTSWASSSWVRSWVTRR